jgi:hypothetical protein
MGACSNMLLMWLLEAWDKNWPPLSEVQMYELPLQTGEWNEKVQKRAYT